MQVDVWRFGDPKNEPTLEAYRDLLKSDRNFRRSTYRAIESKLRNHGREADGNHVYCDMNVEQERLRRSGPAGLAIPSWHVVWERVRRLVFPVWRDLLRFGTDPTPLAVVILLFALLSLPVYSNRDNLELSSDAAMKQRIGQLFETAVPVSLEAQTASGESLRSSAPPARRLRWDRPRPPNGAHGIS